MKIKHREVRELKNRHIDDIIDSVRDVRALGIPVVAKTAFQSYFLGYRNFQSSHINLPVTTETYNAGRHTNGVLFLKRYLHSKIERYDGARILDLKEDEIEHCFREKEYEN